MEVVSWMYIYVKWTRCQSNIAMHWPEEWHEAYRTLVCSKLDGWWWFCVLNDSTFFASLFGPLFTHPALALLQMLRRSFQEHVSHHIFRNLDLSWQAILENHSMTDSIQSHEPWGYVSWPGDLCEEFLGSTRNQSQSAMAHASPFRTSLASLWCRRLPRRLWWSYPLHPLRCPSSQHCFWQETTVTKVASHRVLLYTWQCGACKCRITFMLSRKMALLRTDPSRDAWGSQLLKGARG